jgi:hypothetical protein
MRNWFTRWMTFLTGRDQARTPRRTDWRGRPLGENAGGAGPPVSPPERKRYATLNQASFPEAPGVPPSEGPRTGCDRAIPNPTPDSRPG